MVQGLLHPPYVDLFAATNKHKGTLEPSLGIMNTKLEPLKLKSQMKPALDTRNLQVKNQLGPVGQCSKPRQPSTLASGPTVLLFYKGV